MLNKSVTRWLEQNVELKFIFLCNCVYFLVPRYNNKLKYNLSISPAYKSNC